MKLKFFIIDHRAKIFDNSRQLSMPGRFDFMKYFVRQFWKKNVSCFQLFVYIFQKIIFFFHNCRTKNFIKSNLPGIESCLLEPNI